MNDVRILMSLFILVLIALAVAGWIWAGDQPSPQSQGSRAALSFCALAGIVGLLAIWRAEQKDPGSRHA